MELLCRGIVGDIGYLLLREGFLVLDAFVLVSDGEFVLEGFVVFTYYSEVLLVVEEVLLD